MEKTGRIKMALVGSCTALVLGLAPVAPVMLGSGAVTVPLGARQAQAKTIKKDGHYFTILHKSKAKVKAYTTGDFKKYPGATVKMTNSKFTVWGSMSYCKLGSKSPKLQKTRMTRTFKAGKNLKCYILRDSESYKKNHKISKSKLKSMIKKSGDIDGLELIVYKGKVLKAGFYDASA